MDDNEKSLLINKKYTCPVCDSQMTAKAVKSNAARFVETKADLRPVHSNINVTKYDAVCCPKCGYSALTKYFAGITSTQKKAIREKIQQNFKPREETDIGYYTTQQAIARMKLVLLSTVTKNAKSSEIGQVCLKICWLYQDLADEIDESDPDADAKRESYLKESDSAAMNAYEHLSKARMSEEPPIAGMNESTLDYLLAYFAFKKGEYSTAAKLLSNVITDRNATQRLKDKALDLKEQLSPYLHDDH
jgi:uncharacterized protein (DUF2225 family)